MDYEQHLKNELTLLYRLLASGDRNAADYLKRIKPALLSVLENCKADYSAVGTSPGFRKGASEMVSRLNAIEQAVVSGRIDTVQKLAEQICYTFRTTQDHIPSMSFTEHAMSIKKRADTGGLLLLAKDAA